LLNEGTCTVIFSIVFFGGTRWWTMVSAVEEGVGLRYGVGEMVRMASRCRMV
jgi:hypothetical protein